MRLFSMRSMALAAILVLMVMAFATLPVFAQGSTEVKDFVAAGVNWNQYAAPQVNGSLMYARNISGGTYSFTMMDIFSKTMQPFTVTTSITTGVGQHIKDIGIVRIYGLTTIGVAAGGAVSSSDVPAAESSKEDKATVGWAWTGGFALPIPIGKKGWCLMPTVRFIKSSFSDFQGIYGVSIGWGK